MDKPLTIDERGFPPDSVVRGWQIDGTSDFGREVIVPKGCVEIIFNFSVDGVFYRRGGGDSSALPRCFITGISTVPVILDHRSHHAFLGLRVYPHVVGSLPGYFGADVERVAADGLDEDGDGYCRYGPVNDLATRVLQETVSQLRVTETAKMPLMRNIRDMKKVSLKSSNRSMPFQRVVSTMGWVEAAYAVVLSQALVLVMLHHSCRRMEAFGSIPPLNSLS